MTPEAEEVLAWEAANRGRAGVAALAASVLTVLGVILTTLSQPGASEFDDKIVTVVDAMGRAANGEPIPPGRISAFTVDVGQHPVAPIAGAILYGLGSLAIYFAMAYLFRAARARRPAMQQVALVLAAVGAVGFGVGRAVAEVARYLGAHDFVNAADKTNSAATTRSARPPPSSASSSGRPAALALGFGIAMISLNAMRVGLLSRFMGVLGVIVGVAVAPILPIDQQGIIRVFWLAALGLLFLGRWPAGTPKAWTTGEAEPWPTQQQLREQRDAARAEREPSGRAPSAAPPTPAAGGAQPAATRSRRRRQRAQRIQEEEAQAPLLSGVRRQTIADAVGGVDRDGQQEVSTSDREGISWKLEPFSLSPRRASPQGASGRWGAGLLRTRARWDWPGSP